MSTQPIRGLGVALSALAERWVPNPFVFALVLTYVVFVAGLAIEGRSTGQMLAFWNQGFWGLLEFGMQMVLVIATGYALAYHPRIQGGLARLAKIPANGEQAAVLIGLVAMVAAWFHWGLGLIVGAVFAREIGRQLHGRGIPAHYPLLCVAGYMGLGLTWHWGLSGSAPLLMNTPNNFFVGQGLVDGVLSPTLTIFHPYTLTLLVVTVLATLAILYALSPPEGRVKPISEYVDEDELSLHPPRRGDGAGGGPEPHGPSEAVPADRVDRSRTVGGLVALGGITMTGLAFGLEGLDALRINTVNFGLLFIGLALYSAPDAYQEEFYDAVRSAAGVVLLFPFYAGIIGMMNLSGLSTTLSVWLLEFATADTLPAVTWLAAGFVNVFVPSGGAQWNLMGVEILERAQQLGVPPGKAVVAFGAGDAYTNLVQPFWAIPLLGITGIRARDLFGYAMAVMVLLGPVLAIALIAVPY